MKSALKLEKITEVVKSQVELFQTVIEQDSHQTKQLNLYYHLVKEHNSKELQDPHFSTAKGSNDISTALSRLNLCQPGHKGRTWH